MRMQRALALTQKNQPPQWKQIADYYLEDYYPLTEYNKRNDA